MTMRTKSIQIDRDKRRAEVRKLGSESVFFMLDEAIEVLSPAKLAPGNSSVLNDYGWALTELGRFAEAEPALQKAVQLASPGDELPRTTW
jgi:hypothetical protein